MQGLKTQVTHRGSFCQEPLAGRLPIKSSVWSMVIAVVALAKLVITQMDVVSDAVL
jgi:hypothetical protein